jgi:hypothetical protein
MLGKTFAMTERFRWSSVPEFNVTNTTVALPPGSFGTSFGTITTLDLAYLVCAQTAFLMLEMGLD